MSQENVEVARQLAEAFQRGLEHDDPEAMFDTGLLADDWEWVVEAPFEGKSVWTGRQEFVEFFRLWIGEFEDYSVRFEEPIDAGDDRVSSSITSVRPAREAAPPSTGTWA